MSEMTNEELKAHLHDIIDGIVDTGTYQFHTDTFGWETKKAVPHIPYIIEHPEAYRRAPKETVRWIAYGSDRLTPPCKTLDGARNSFTFDRIIYPEFFIKLTRTEGEDPKAEVVMP